MPWHLEPKKDVAICDKPRGADKRALIRGCPNGETPLGASCYPVTPAWIYRAGRGNVGKWNLSVPTGRENNSDSGSSGERNRNRPNRSCVIAGGRCMVGVVGLLRCSAGQHADSCCIDEWSWKASHRGCQPRSRNAALTRRGSQVSRGPRNPKWS